ncbi:hypothetical protein EDWATA_02203 [Edwardsiella tarda ATCC 23685]|uniref:Uncharacterized protein n=1 Tax=Edwardsiella tarda ATCC 23685 TaxID=500638 RepID=D4F623_EDWTA|nr:hypothetical protein EDWATA_02203 [Edwardsiella tarda ATCC 23685]
MLKTLNTSQKLMLDLMSDLILLQDQMVVVKHLFSQLLRTAWRGMVNIQDIKMIVSTG